MFLEVVAGPERGTGWRDASGRAGFLLGARALASHGPVDGGLVLQMDS